MVERKHNTPEQLGESEILIGFIIYAEIDIGLFRLLCSGLDIDTVTPETVIERANDIGLKDMVKLRGKDAKVNLAFDVYQAQIMKYIGEGIAALGGLDNIIFSGSNVSILTPIVYDIVKKISFLGINIIALPWSNGIDIMNITSEDSKIKGYINKTDIAKIIFDESEIFMKKSVPFGQYR